MKNNGLSAWQTDVLQKLVSSYETSATYRGKNKVQQSFNVHPEEVFAGYTDNMTDVDEVRSFERDMKSLQELGLVRLKWNKRGTEIQRICAVEERFPEVYVLLSRPERRKVLEELRDLYGQYLGAHPMLDTYCREKLAGLEHKKKPESGDEKDFLHLMKFLLNNHSELLERELSMQVFSDSKRFEQEFRTRACSFLKKYGDYGELLEGTSEKEQSAILLAECNVEANPGFVYFKGEAVLAFSDGSSLSVPASVPVGVSSASLQSLEHVCIAHPTVMTVENLTSFHRVPSDSFFCMFLSGYHNTAKQRLLQKIARDNPGKTWLHFGDLDPDGYSILQHLRQGTGIDFQPWCMGSEMLHRYAAYGKELTEHDRKWIRALREQGVFPEEMDAMEETGKKLEQEIISWNLFGTDRRER